MPNSLVEKWKAKKGKNLELKGYNSCSLSKEMGIAFAIEATKINERS